MHASNAYHLLTLIIFGGVLLLSLATLACDITRALPTILRVLWGSDA